MAKTSVLSMAVQIVGDGVNETYNIVAVNPVVNPAAPGGGPLLYALITGANTIPVPPGSISMVIAPPPASVVALTLKGLTGDTGFPLAPNLPAMLPLPTGTLTVLIDAAAPENVSILWL
jgi:hypothetical protein